MVSPSVSSCKSVFSQPHKAAVAVAPGGDRGDPDLRNSHFPERMLTAPPLCQPPKLSRVPTRWLTKMRVVGVTLEPAEQESHTSRLHLAGCPRCFPRGVGFHGNLHFCFSPQTAGREPGTQQPRPFHKPQCSPHDHGLAGPEGKRPAGGRPARHVPQWPPLRLPEEAGTCRQALGTPTRMCLQRKAHYFMWFLPKSAKDAGRPPRTHVRARKSSGPLPDHGRRSRDPFVVSGRF